MGAQKSKIENKKIILFSLVILIVIVISLIILYSYYSNYDMTLPRSGLPACIANSGYLCQNPIYNHNNGYIIVIVGQDVGSNWTTAKFVFVPAGKRIINLTPPTLFTKYPANTFYSTTGLISGQAVNISLQVNNTNASVAVGTLAEGSIWAQYTTTNNQTLQYVKMAIINVKAN